MNYSNETAEVNAVFLHETKKAVLVCSEFGEEVWIPKSQLVDFPCEQFSRKDHVTIEVSEWFATKNDLV
jgi:hypothetical protein